MATCKVVMRPALEYASSIWSPLASSTSINKLQVMQNAALRTATGCTQDTNIQHLHDETLILPIHEHLQLHASQYKQHTQDPSHPLHKHTTYFNTPRLKHQLYLTTAATQQTFPQTPHTITTTDIKRTCAPYTYVTCISERCETVNSLKKDKSPGVDNIPAELILAGDNKVIDVLTTICNSIWKNGKWPTPWTQSLVITLPKRGNLQLCQNYRTISLISHPSKVMLKVIQNRQKPQAEAIIAEEQAGFRAGRSTCEQIFNLRVLCEKYAHHQQHLYHVFIDFKKAFDRVCHEALWTTMKNYNISHDLICSIKGLYSNATSAVFNNGSIGEWFQASFGVRQGCLLSPTLFNIFLERIMTDALDGHAGTVSIGGRPLTNLRFADDIDGLAGSEEELRELLGRLEKASKDYGMEIGGEKTKIMTNNINGMTTALHIAGNTLDEVHNFKYLGAIISEEGSKPEVLARIAQATAALSSLKKIWRDRNITLRSKIRLLRSLVISIFLYACESWTLTADLQRRIQAMDMRCYRRLLNISYTEHITNVEVRNRIERAIGPYEDLLSTVKRRKLKWYGHVSRSSGLSKTIMQGTVKGGRRRGGQRKRWEDNIKDWTCLRAGESLRVSKDRNG